MELGPAGDSLERISLLVDELAPKCAPLGERVDGHED
jgi:hypothetical protein